MAVTDLAAIIDPAVFTPYMDILSTEKTAFWQSGVVVTDPAISALVAGGGTTFQMPKWGDLAQTEANKASDNPATVATPLAIGTVKEQARRQNRNQAWSSMDLASDVAGSDAQGAIARRVAAYWGRQHQRSLIASLNGILADNVANDSGDMVYDIATDDAGAITAAELIGTDAVIQAALTMGDNSDGLIALAVHSVPFARLQSLNLITFVPFEDQDLRVPTFLGKRVIVDDGLPAVAGTNRITYTSVLFAAGAVGFGSSPPRVPVEVDRVVLAGAGSGQEVLVSRQQYTLHPRGFSWEEASVAADNPTNAELATAANWNRVFPERKQVPIAFLQTNG